MARVGGRLALPQNRFADARGTYKLSQRPLARNIVKPSYQAELLQVVPSGRELCAGGDARIRGKEKPAGSRASCRPLLRFVPKREPGGGGAVGVEAASRDEFAVAVRS